MAKLSYLSASETRALLCKYFDKVCAAQNLRFCIFHLCSHLLLLANLCNIYAEENICKCLP